MRSLVTLISSRREERLDVDQGMCLDLMTACLLCVDFRFGLSLNHWREITRRMTLVRSDEIGRWGLIRGKDVAC